MKLSHILKRSEKFIVDNSSTILTAVGVTGTITTAYLTGKATYRVARIVNHPESREPNPDARLFIKAFWKEYIPAVGVGTVTIVAIVGANRVGTRRAAAVAAAYSLSERAFDEYKTKVVEKMGENKEREVRDELAQDRVKRTEGSEVVILSDGEVLCFDQFSGRYFRSDMESLKKAMNDTNYQILNHVYASLSDFYDRVGLAHTSFSDEIGWNSDEQLELEFSTTLSEDGRPCIAIDFKVAPVRDYFRVH
jgi:hypothetical protein